MTARTDGKTADELLAAYVDGVGELTTDERRLVEARLVEDPMWRSDADATRDLLGTLRALSDEGAEPDWAAMERAIRDEVGADAPRAWWRGWRWLIPVSALAISGAVLALVLRAPVDAPPAPISARSPDAGVPIVAPAPLEIDDGTVPLWLDGAQVDVDLQAGELLGDDPLGTDDEAEGGLLPAADLAWVDELGDDDIAAAEAWLARKKS